MTAAVSITAPQFTRHWGDLARAAMAAERLGFDGMFFFDHLVPIGEPSRPVFELASTLGAIAAATTNLRIGTLVLRVPLRGPEVSEQIAATVSTIAPGRFVLGLGAGDKVSLEEARRFGMDPGTLRERVESLGSLIGRMEVTQPEIPVWVGGTHPAILGLVRRFGTGWNAWGVPVDRFAEMAATVQGPATWGGRVVLGRDSAEAASLAEGRRAVIGDPQTVADALNRYLAVGASELVLSILPNRPECWELFAAEVLPKLWEQATTGL